MFGKRKSDESGDLPATPEIGRRREGDPAAQARPVGRSGSLSNKDRQGGAGLQDQQGRVSGYLGPAQRRMDSRIRGEEAEGTGRKLVVGREISLSGEIKACETLIVEGQVEADLQDCKTLKISETGLYKGNAQVEAAEIRGRFEGDLTVTAQLNLRAGGRVVGSLRYADLQVERGGKIVGTIEEIAAPAERTSAETEGETLETAASARGRARRAKASGPVSA
jgi:cytoskeletal protein CcmA (bactofilin family)